MIHKVQFFNVKILDALVSVELISCVLSIADLAQDFNFWAFHFDMIVELSSGHMLILIKVANITTKFRAMVLSMCLKLSQGFPNNFLLARTFDAAMRELAEINTVAENFVDLLHEVTLGITIWTTGRLILALRQKALWLSTSAISASRHHLVIHLLGKVTEVSWLISNFF